MSTDAAKKLLEACAGECPVDATETCTQKPDCPDYLAAGAWRAARDKIEALAPDLLRVAIGAVEALDIAEAAMDELNGDTGTKSRPCSFCRAEVYNAEVGIEHSPARPELGDAGCPVGVARKALAEWEKLDFGKGAPA